MQVARTLLRLFEELSMGGSLSNPGATRISLQRADFVAQPVTFHQHIASWVWLAHYGYTAIGDGGCALPSLASVTNDSASVVAKRARE